MNGILFDSKSIHRGKTKFDFDFLRNCYLYYIKLNNN